VSRSPRNRRKEAMKYYAWIQYYAGPPVNKNVKSAELRYYTGHKHGVMPTQDEINSLQEDLEVCVQKAYARIPGAVYPGDPTVLANREVKTRSAK
jgi:hypothetical protein